MALPPNTDLSIAQRANPPAATTTTTTTTATTPAAATPTTPLPGIIWKGANPANWHSGRYKSIPVQAIVIHLMDGSLTGTDAWFNDPKAIVSAHYGIGHSGEIHQYVQESDTAYHAGRSLDSTWIRQWPYPSANSFSIGIEHEDHLTDPWPDAMLASSARLIANICTRHQIPCDRQHIVGHHEIYSAKPCPGPLCPLDALVARAAALTKAVL